jgi:hypothetical protein
LRNLPFFSHFVLRMGNWCPNTRLGCQFPPRNTKWLKNGKLRKAILSAFYNISQRKFGILLILRCSFKLWWNFCLDQNFSYKGKGPFCITVNGTKSHLFSHCEAFISGLCCCMFFKLCCVSRFNWFSMRFDCKTCRLSIDHNIFCSY